MSKFNDVMLSFVFSIIIGFYTLQGLAFGGLSGESPFMYALFSTIGIILTWISFKDNIYKFPIKLITIRFLSLLLFYPLIYFEVKHSYIDDETCTLNKILYVIIHPFSIISITYFIMTGIIIFKTKNRNC